MKKYKKPLLLSLLGVDFALTVFLLVISIIMIATIVSNGNNPQEAAKHASGMIKFFIKNPTAYLFICVIPLFLLLAANIIGLVLYVRKTSKKEPTKLDDLSEEQKEALRQELLKDLQGENKKE